MGLLIAGLLVAFVAIFKLTGSASGSGSASGAGLTADQKRAVIDAIEHNRRRILAFKWALPTSGRPDGSDAARVASEMERFDPSGYGESSLDVSPLDPSELEVGPDGLTRAKAGSHLDSQVARLHRAVSSFQRFYNRAPNPVPWYAGSARADAIDKPSGAPLREDGVIDIATDQALEPFVAAVGGAEPPTGVAAPRGLPSVTPGDAMAFVPTTPAYTVARTPYRGGVLAPIGSAMPMSLADAKAALARWADLSPAADPSRLFPPDPADALEIIARAPEAGVPDWSAAPFFAALGTPSSVNQTFHDVFVGFNKSDQLLAAQTLYAQGLKWLAALMYLRMLGKN